MYTNHIRCTSTHNLQFLHTDEQLAQEGTHPKSPIFALPTLSVFRRPVHSYHNARQAALLSGEFHRIYLQIRHLLTLHLVKTWQRPEPVPETRPLPSGLRQYAK